MTAERLSKYGVAFALALSVHLGIVFALSRSSEPEIKIKGGAIQVDFISPTVSESGDTGSDTEVVSEDAVDPSEPPPAEAEPAPKVPESAPEPEPPAPEPEPAPPPDPEPEPIPDPEPPKEDPAPEPEPLPEPEPTPPVEQPRPSPQVEPVQSETSRDTASESQTETTSSDQTDISNDPDESDVGAQSAPSQPGTQAVTTQGAQSSVAQQTDVAQELGNAEEEDYRGEVLRHLSRARPISGDKRDSAVIAFTILPSGELENLRIGRSSGKKRFDRAALKSIERVAPVPPPPNGERFDFTVRIDSK
ncbi:MAG: TonB family protein [Pseudomonadota bacterium]